MEVVDWVSGVNDRFFAYSSKPKENTVTSEYISGRTVSTNVNTKNIMVHNFNVKLSKEELALFWTWFNDVLGQKSLAFRCPALGNNIYRFTSIPEPQDTDLKYRVLSCEVEEVF